MSTLVEPFKSARFMTLKDGSGKPPIFIVHGVCGRVQFSRLAQHIQTDNPVYGIQARGIHGEEQPCNRIEEMSSVYLEALSQYCPDGPYILIGYSFGGLIALEMAQRLLQQNRMCVPLLLLVDTYPHPRFLISSQRARLLFRRLRTHLENVRQLSLFDASSYFMRRFKNRQSVFSTTFKGVTKRHLRQNSAVELVEKGAYDALANYKPEFYPGKIHFITPDEKTFFPEDPGPIWGHLAAKLELDIIPGNHLSMVTTEFAALAAVITRHVREFDSREARNFGDR